MGEEVGRVDESGGLGWKVVDEMSRQELIDEIFNLELKVSLPSLPPSRLPAFPPLVSNPHPTPNPNPRSHPVVGRHLALT